jgi:hypothetical protein
MVGEDSASDAANRESLLLDQVPGLIIHTGVPTAKRFGDFYAFGFGVFMSLM